MSIKKRDETISVRRRQRRSRRRQPRLSAGGMTDDASRYEEHDKKPRDHGLSFSGQPIGWWHPQSRMSVKFRNARRPSAPTLPLKSQDLRHGPGGGSR